MMSTSALSVDYIAMLRSAMSRPEVRAYCLSRLEVSLASIGITPNCRTDVLQFLMNLIKNGQPTGESLHTAIHAFSSRWGAHLQRAYFRDYEARRWRFAKDFVFNNLSPSLGRVLDVGCGRGCFTMSIVQDRLATEAVGIDEADFSDEWSERSATLSHGVNFQKISVDTIGDWASHNGKFDTILLFYVLHHSNDYWVAKTLDGLRHALKPGGSVVILEDSLVLNVAAVEDATMLCQEWMSWTQSAPTYTLSAGYDVQVILDFVAVQLLARFEGVNMPCNYKTSLEWQTLFGQLGFRMEKVVNIGFPRFRDIDVPQALFIIKAID